MRLQIIIVGLLLSVPGFAQKDLAKKSVVVSTSRAGEITFDDLPPGKLKLSEFIEAQRIAGITLTQFDFSGGREFQEVSKAVPYMITDVSKSNYARYSEEFKRRVTEVMLNNYKIMGVYVMQIQLYFLDDVLYRFHIVDRPDIDTVVRKDLTKLRDYILKSQFKRPSIDTLTNGVRPKTCRDKIFETGSLEVSYSENNRKLTFYHYRATYYWGGPRCHVSDDANTDFSDIQLRETVDRLREK